MVFGRKPVYVPPAAPAPPPQRQAPPAPSIDTAVHNNRMRQTHLEARMRKCEADIDALKRDMQRCRPGTGQYNMYKHRLTQAIRERKRINQQIATQFSFESNLTAVQDARYQMEDAAQMAATLKVSGQELKASQQQINVDEVQDIQDDMADIIADTNEVQDILGRDYGLDGVDEADLEAELQEYESEMGYSTNVQASETPSYLLPTPGAASSNIPYSSSARPYANPYPR